MYGVPPSIFCIGGQKERRKKEREKTQGMCCSCPGFSFTFRTLVQSFADLRSSGGNNFRGPRQKHVLRGRRRHFGRDLAGGKKEAFGVAR